MNVTLCDLCSERTYNSGVKVKLNATGTKTVDVCAGCGKKITEAFAKNKKEDALI